MNPWYTFKKENLERLLSEWKKNAEVYVPLTDNEKHFWRVYDGTFSVSGLPGTRIHESAKKLFFPQRRVMAAYNTGSRWSMEPVEPAAETRIIVGLHPCDVSALEYMDAVFTQGNAEDPLYSAERDRTVIVGMFCSEMAAGCHCTERGVVPVDEHGMDVVLAESGDDYMIRWITDKGKAIFDQTDIPEPGSAEPPLITVDIPERVLPKPEAIMEFENQEFWNRASDFCLACGVCAFNCPTCTCFQITDEQYRGSGERSTVWDSCQFRDYTRMAGGHNPRSEPVQRVKNRILDKFAYSRLKYDILSCVGCGRCEMNCPNQIDFRGLVREMVDEINNRA